MAVIKNVRQIFPPAVGGQVEVVYDEGDCKYIFPHETDIQDTQQVVLAHSQTRVLYIRYTAADASKIKDTCDI